MKIKNFIAGVITVIVFAIPAYAEFVFLKDGSIVEGKIVSDAAGSITIRDKENRVKILQRGSIMRVLYTSLKLGKIYIQKRDGEGIVAFMVDEDRDSYTFRKDLYKPEEFVIERSDVLFIAEKNPSGLKGVAETDRVSLTWLPPYDAVKHYNVYYSTGKSEKYKLAGSSWGKSYTLSNLASNKTYYIIVTSVDSDNYESSPSNELKIATKNIPPDAPDVISMKNTLLGEKEFKWEESSDPDGKIVQYRLYGILNKKREIISEVNKTAYISKKELNYDRVAVTAVDNGGDESVYSDFYRKALTLSVNPIAVLPFGEMKELFNYGYGASMNLSALGYFIDGSLISIDSGYIRWSGNNENINNMNMIPTLFSAGYSFYMTNNISLTALLGAGAVYMSTSYINAAYEAEKKSTFEPVCKAGLYMKYDFNDSIVIFAGGSFFSIYEPSRLKNFIGTELSIGYKIY